MTHHIDGKDCMISEWILLVLAYLFVGARLYYTRLSRARSPDNDKLMAVADCLLLVSALDALGLIICDTLTYRLGVMDRYEPSVQLSKISFASNYLYDVGMGFPKLSMLALYATSYFSSAPRKPRSPPRAPPPLWWYPTTAFVAACYLAILFDDTFFCGKRVAVQWAQDEGACSVFYAPEPFILNFTLNLACYLVVYAVPVLLLLNGRLPMSVGVGVALALGALTIAASLVRFVTLKVGTGQENLVYPLSMLEMALSIIVVSLPGLKPLIPSTKY
ncbi:hypothetical protein ACEQ8H_002281 [Pleosporales sp. CAS-2024a]